MKNFSILLMMVLIAISCTSNDPKSNYRDVTPEWVVEAINVKTPETVVVPGGTELKHEGYGENKEEGLIRIELVPGQTTKSGDFSVKSDLKVVKQLADLGNCLVFKQKFLDKIAAHKQFDYTKESSKDVANRLSLFAPVVLTTYSKRFTKAIAYRNIGSNVIYLNTYKLPSKPTKERLNTIWHERSHVAGFGHGSNSSKGKENSVPFGTGKMAEDFFDECYAEVIKEGA